METIPSCDSVHTPQIFFMILAGITYIIDSNIHPQACRKNYNCHIRHDQIIIYNYMMSSTHVSHGQYVKSSPTLHKFHLSLEQGEVILL
jgi:hypothetical protein